jgi:hypothetical protein
MKQHVKRELTNCPEFMNFIHIVAKDRLPVLPHDKGLTTVDICGEAVSSVLSRGERRLAGKCMKKLIEENLLPFEPVEKKHEYPLYYRLR